MPNRRKLPRVYMASLQQGTLRCQAPCWDHGHTQARLHQLEISSELKPLSAKETREAVLFAVPQTRVRSIDKRHFYVHADRVGIDDTHVAAYEWAMRFPDDLTYDELRRPPRFSKFNDRRHM